MSTLVQLVTKGIASPSAAPFEAGTPRCRPPGGTEVLLASRQRAPFWGLWVVGRWLPLY
jgi:hypothetical protein